MDFVNTALLKNPLNWFIILFMLVIAGAGFHFVVKLFQSSGNAANLANPVSTNTEQS